MTSWAAVLALTGFHYSGVTATMEFAGRPGTTAFWSTGYAWGTCRQQLVGKGMKIRLEVLHGEVKLSQLILREADSKKTKCFEAGNVVRAGQVVEVTVG